MHGNVPYHSIHALTTFIERVLSQIAWAPGKGMKDKQWKDYWDVELGVLYIPIDKLDPQVSHQANPLRYSAIHNNLTWNRLT